MTMPFGRIQSSSTGTGSLTSQSSSSINSGRPVSIEQILKVVSSLLRISPLEYAPIPIVHTPPHAPSHLSLHRRIGADLNVKSNVLGYAHGSSKPNPTR